MPSSLTSIWEHAARLDPTLAVTAGDRAALRRKEVRAVPYSRERLFTEMAAGRPVVFTDFAVRVDGPPDAGVRERLLRVYRTGFPRKRRAHGWASPFAPAMDHVYATTFLGRPHAIGGASLSDAYAVTHTVAYMTDFGALPFAPAQRAGVVADLDGVLELALTWQNFDLSAEVLAALGWLRAPQTEQGERAWSRLAMQQLPSGAVLGVRGDADLIATLGAAEDPSFFALLYHSTLVTALASLTVTAGGSAPLA